MFRRRRRYRHRCGIWPFLFPSLVILTSNFAPNCSFVIPKGGYFIKFELFFRSKGRQFDQKIQMPHPTSLRPNMCYHASHEIKTLANECPPMKRRKQRRPDLRLRSERTITSRRKETHKYDPSQIFLRVEWNLSRPTICLGNFGSWKGGSCSRYHSPLLLNQVRCFYLLSPGDGYFLVMGMCRWMGSHSHGWIDYNGVAFS